MQGFRYLEDVVTLQLDPEKCIGCGMCVEVCPHRVFSLEGGKARVDDRDGCIECGGCARNCPVEAISVKAGVGCASAILTGWLKGTEPVCGCSGDEDGGGCC